MKRMGEAIVKVESFTPLGKSLRPPHVKWHGLVDTEIRYRQRSLDLIEDRRVIDGGRHGPVLPVGDPGPGRNGASGAGGTPPWRAPALPGVCHPGVGPFLTAVLDGADGGSRTAASLLYFRPSSSSSSSSSRRGARNIPDVPAAQNYGCLPLPEGPSTLPRSSTSKFGEGGRLAWALIPCRNEGKIGTERV
jgi:hypothetical protein